MLTTSTPATVLDSNDPGDDVQRRFRYQAGYTAMISLDLLDANSELEEIFCEHHEDTLVKQKDGKFIGIQVKTREEGRDLFKADDQQIITAIKRFVLQHIEFPNCYSKFVLATNYAFWCDDKTSFKNLSYVCEVARRSNSNPISKLPAGLSAYMRKLRTEIQKDIHTKVEDAVILEVLCMIELQANLPKFDDIQTRLAYQIPDFLLCPDAGFPDLIKAAKKLISKIADASSLEYISARQTYFALFADPLQLRANAIIEGKRITRAIVQQALQEHLSDQVLLSTRNSISVRDIPASIHKMERKMAAGGISVPNIGNAKDHKYSMEKLASGWIYKYGSDNADKRYKHLCVIIGNECQEAHDSVSGSGEPYGHKMLVDVRQRLRGRLNAEPTLFLDCTYEHLLGVAGILTEQCKVWWSEEFEMLEAKVE